MKAIKYFVLAVFAFMAISCADEAFTPRNGEDDDDPIVIGGGGGGGAGNPSGGTSQGNTTPPDSVVFVP